MYKWLLGVMAWMCLTGAAMAAEVSLQFKETAYYLKDICMLNADTG